MKANMWGSLANLSPLKGLLIVLLFGAWGSADGGQGLEFFPATYSQEKYEAQPHRYDRLTLSIGGKPKEVYVERGQAALTIPLQDVESVTATREVRDQKMDEAMERELLKQDPSRKILRNRAEENFDVSFLFSDRGAKQLWEFSRRHPRKLFEARLNGHSIGLVRFADPSTTYEREMTLMLSSRETLNRIKKVYPQIKVK